MIELLSNRLSEFIQNNAEDTNNKTKEMGEVISCGSRILVSTLFNLSVVLGLGIISHRFFGSILFLVSFCSLKGFSGGFHAKTLKGCVGITIAVFSSVILFQDYAEMHLAYLLAVDFVLTVFLVKYAPLGTPQNPFPPKIRRIRKIKTLVMAYSLLGCFTLFSGSVVYFGLAGIFWAEIMFMIGRVLYDEKKN